MKCSILSAFFFCCASSFAQQKSIPLSTSLTNSKLFEKAFNNDTIQLLDFKSGGNTGGLFVLYQKSDTLNFKNTFYSNHPDRENYILQGLAYYEKKPGAWRLKFANDYALFCASCNNMHGYDMNVHKDTVQLSITWGPNSFSSTETYWFTWRPALKRWQLSRTKANGSDDAGEERRIYQEFNSNSNLFLDNYIAETLLSEQPSGTTAGTLSLYYKPGNYKGLLDSLYRVPQSSFPMLPFVFSTTDATYFNNEPITGKQVQSANDVGYFLEQANSLAVAEIILKQVIEAFPKREVAYYNLGDVYLKQGNKALAAVNYNIYINLMTERKLQSKIPKKVQDFVNANRGLLSN